MIFIDILLPEEQRRLSHSSFLLIIIVIQTQLGVDYMKEHAIGSGLSNYYGEVIAYEEDGKFYMSLEDHNITLDTLSTEKKVVISKEFFEAFKKEFT